MMFGRRHSVGWGICSDSGCMERPFESRKGQLSGLVVFVQTFPYRGKGQ